MGHDDAECCYEEAVEELNIVLMKCPQFKEKACKEIESLTKKLALEAKLVEEAHELKDHLKLVSHELNPIDKIKDGFLKFKTHFKKEHELFQNMVESERAKIMIICCSDSRVDPCAILGLKVGEAHVLRNIINCIPTWWDEKYKSGVASIEYAVAHLKVEHIFIIGHNKCEGLKKLLHSAQEEVKEDTHKMKGSFHEWLLTISKHKHKHNEPSSSPIEEHECYDYCSKETINESVLNLYSYPCVKEALVKEKITIHGGYYNLEEGSFEHWTVEYKMHGAEKY